MSSNPYVQFTAHPRPRSPILLAAFAGWNDASQVATFSLATLLKLWGGQRFAEIDPEEFFDFTETRPTISLTPSRRRSLSWPANAFFAHELPESRHDMVLLVGTEPELKWRTFCRAILHVAEEVDASCLITLGGYLADVPHTAPTPVTGFASGAGLLPRLEKLGIGLSTYEGPTGIVGVLHDAWQATGRPAISLWGNVPHYISATPNPQVSLALLERLAQVLRIRLPLEPLKSEAKSFRTRIDEALQENPEALEYVQQLEENFAVENVPPPGPELIEELEEFLRRRRPPGRGAGE